MLNISEEVRQAFLTDSSDKQLVIKTEPPRENTYDKINFYTGNINETPITKTIQNSFDFLTDIRNDDAVVDYQSYGSYIYVSFNLKVVSYNVMPSKIWFVIYNTSSGDSPQFNYEVDLTDSSILSAITTTGVRVYSRIQTGKIQWIDYLTFFADVTMDWTIDVKELQVSLSDVAYSASELEENVPYLGESIARQGQEIADVIYKGYTLPIADITNSDVEFEAYNQTESLSSGDNLKFGACEASTCQFTVRDRFDNWKDRYIYPRINVVDPDKVLEGVNWYKSAGTRAINATQTYSYANSDLSWQMNTSEHSLATNLNADEMAKFDKIWLATKMRVKFTLSNFSTETRPYRILFWIRYYYGDGEYKEVSWNNYNSFLVSEITEDFIDLYDWRALKPDPRSSYVLPKIYEISKIVYRFLDEDGNRYPAGTRFDYTVEIKDVQIALTNELYWRDYPVWDADDCLDYKGIDVWKYVDLGSGVPLGRFLVTNIKKNHRAEAQRLTITGYDDLIYLNLNAGDWCTMYMYAVNTIQYPVRYGYEYTRQIFSSYWNIMSYLGIDKRSNYEETVLATRSVSEFTSSNYTIGMGDGGDVNIRLFVETVSSDIDVTKPYVVDIEHDYTLDELEMYIDVYLERVDPYARGIYNQAEVYIEETLSSGDTHKFVVNNHDYFMLSPNCVSFNIYAPLWTDYNGSRVNPLALSYKLSRVEKSYDLMNASTCLFYYNYGTGELATYNSNISARDVVRSILEPTGCFLHIDRFGLPAFKYCTKSGLYPSETLYPADNIYPRGLDGGMVSMGNYISADSEDYSVKNIGRIQIVKRTLDSSDKSIVEWEYVGDQKNQNTYLIDDNIFYCNEKSEYEFGSQPEIELMLENMYSRINNMGYTPSEIKMVGMPWLEVGDRIALLTLTGGIESFIFRRTYEGIRVPKDTIESQGDEYIEAVKDYGYKEWS